MGLMSLLGKGPMSPKKIDKVAKLASNPFAQPDVRMREMQRLIEDGSDAALRGLLKRFSVNANGAIADEDEKEAFEAVLALADPELNGYLLQRQTPKSEPIARVIKHILSRPQS